MESFEEVYLNAGIKTAGKNYTILKIAEMVNSRHLSDMTPEAKRNSLMMALEAAGAEIGDLLQDAVTRNRALDEYEEERQEEVRKFEAFKAEENNKLHAELEHLTSQYMSKIQANSDHGGARAGQPPPLAETQTAGVAADHRCGYLLRAARQRLQWQPAA